MKYENEFNFRFDSYFVPAKFLSCMHKTAANAVEQQHKHRRKSFRYFYPTPSCWQTLPKNRCWEQGCKRQAFETALTCGMKVDWRKSVLGDTKRQNVHKGAVSKKCQPVDQSTSCFTHELYHFPYSKAQINQNQFQWLNQYPFCWT